MVGREAKSGSVYAEIGSEALEWDGWGLLSVDGVGAGVGRENGGCDCDDDVVESKEKENGCGCVSGCVCWLAGWPKENVKALVGGVPVLPPVAALVLGPTSPKANIEATAVVGPSLVLSASLRSPPTTATRSTVHNAALRTAFKCTNGTLLSPP